MQHETFIDNNNINIKFNILLSMIEWNLKKGLLYWFVYFIIFTIGTSYVLHYSIYMSLLYGISISTFVTIVMTLVYRYMQRRQS